MRPIRRIHPIVAALLLMSVLLSGCGPGSEQTAMAKAMSARVDARPTYNESAKFLSGHLTKHDRDYVMWSMDYVSICLLSGNYDSAKAELLKCYADIRNRQDTDKEKMAAASNESLKVFKGEPFERAMVCTYLGMLNYMAGDYNNARIFCANADMEDATTEEDMKDYRHDFQIAHYWLGRSFMKLGQVDNARVAFQKAASHLPRKGQDKELSALQKAQAAERDRRMRLEKESYKRASSQNPPVPGATDVSASPAEAQMPQALPNAPAGDDPVLLAA